MSCALYIRCKSTAFARRRLCWCHILEFVHEYKNRLLNSEPRPPHLPCTHSVLSTTTDSRQRLSNEEQPITIIMSGTWMIQQSVTAYSAYTPTVLVQTIPITTTTTYIIQAGPSSPPPPPSPPPQVHVLGSVVVATPTVVLKFW